ncbi:MAG: hypothetical protein JWN98_332 [Abditibacteriota bacterium]|nr:hypothetical protein [Abditibacteriota bacterium]
MPGRLSLRPERGTSEVKESCRFGSLCQEGDSSTAPPNDRRLRSQPQRSNSPVMLSDYFFSNTFKPIRRQYHYQGKIILSLSQLLGQC